MQEVFEKIKQRIRIAATEACGYTPITRVVSEAELKEIIEEVAAEHNNGWIPVEKRLPEESLNSVLGWDEYKQRCCFVQYYSGRWILGNDDEPVKIIAWQPLPGGVRGGSTRNFVTKKVIIN